MRTSVLGRNSPGSAQHVCFINCLSLTFLLLLLMTVILMWSILLDHLTLASTYDVLSSSFDGIRVVRHNVQGIQSKMTEIAGWLKQSINTNCFSKIWLSSNSPPICVKGFHIFCHLYLIVFPYIRDLEGINSIQVPVCLYLRLYVLRGLQCAQRLKVVANFSMCHAVLFCVLIATRLVIVSLYRSPSANPTDCLLELHIPQSRNYLWQHIPPFCAPMMEKPLGGG